jgi:hypothetical protein
VLRRYRVQAKGAVIEAADATRLLVIRHNERVSSGEEIELYAKAAGDALSTLAGTSPGSEAADWLADRIRGRRAQVQVKVLQQTMEAIKAAGLQGQVVPAKTLVPLLEFAGLEEEADTDMISRWAQLLAHAATGDGIPPSYPHLLAQLDSRQVMALDRLFEVGREATYATQQAVGIPIELIYDLGRLRLVEFRIEHQPGLPEDDWTLSWLGHPFVRACRPLQEEP